MTSDVRSYEDLRVWQDAMLFAEAVYWVCNGLPKEETYGLASQLKRAAVSIPSNIAEGSGRSGTKELIQFLCVARGSLAEVNTQLQLASRLYGVLISEELAAIGERLSRGLMNLIKSLQQKSPATRHPSPATLP